MPQQCFLTRILTVFLKEFLIKVVHNPHEYSYCDDANDVLCHLEIRQVEKTKVDENSHNVFYIVQGNEATPDELLMSTAQKIINETVKYCGGKGRIIVPDII